MIEVVVIVIGINVVVGIVVVVVNVVVIGDPRKQEHALEIRDEG